MSHPSSSVQLTSTPSNGTPSQGLSLAAALPSVGPGPRAAVPSDRRLPHPSLRAQRGLRPSCPPSPCSLLWVAPELSLSEGQAVRAELVRSQCARAEHRQRCGGFSLHLLLELLRSQIILVRSSTVNVCAPAPCSPERVTNGSSFCI